MNEYVLSANQQKLPIPKDCIACGVQQEITITTENPFDNCFEFGQEVGQVVISWEVSGPIRGSFDVLATYDGVTVTNSNNSSSGQLIFNKDKIGKHGKAIESKVRQEKASSRRQRKAE